MTADVIRTDTPNLAVVIPVWEGERTRKLVTSLPPNSYRRLILVGGPADLPGAEIVPKNGGYNHGCNAAVGYLRKFSGPDQPIVVAFLDSQCDPTQLTRLTSPVLRNEFPIVIGSRRLRKLPPGALSLLTITRNWLACQLIRRFLGKVYTDISPLRAVAWSAIPQTGTNLLGLQINAVRSKLKVLEVPVDYHP